MKKPVLQSTFTVGCKTPEEVLTLRRLASLLHARAVIKNGGNRIRFEVRIYDVLKDALERALRP